MKNALTAALNRDPVDAGNDAELLAFLAFRVKATAGGLLFELVPQALAQGANDNDAQLVGVVLWAL